MFNFTSSSSIVFTDFMLNSSSFYRVKEKFKQFWSSLEYV